MSELRAYSRSAADQPGTSYQPSIVVLERYSFNGQNSGGRSHYMPSEPAEKSGCCKMASSNTKNLLYVIFLVVFILLVIAVILLAVSFQGMEYYEMGYKRRRTTGSVDTSKLFQAGLHAIGPDYEFKKFPASAHFEKFERISVFNADRLEVTISAWLQYFLRPHQLLLLHKNFDIHYRPILQKNALDALKGAITVFSNREMILERNKIEKTLFKAVKERLGGRCCELNCSNSDTVFSLHGRCAEGCKPYDTCTEADFGLFAEVRYFQLHELITPSGLKARFLRALVLQEEQERELLRQTAIIIRKETDQLVRQTTNEAAEISNNATAVANLIKAKAQATAKATLEGSRSDGLKHLYDELGLTTEKQKTEFDYLRTLRRHDQAQLAVDYQTYVAGPMLKNEL